MAHLVEVAFRGNRKEFFLWDYPDPPAIKAAVIVDADRGEDLGYVHSLGELAQKRNGGCSHGCGTAAPTRKALRLATARDRASAEELARQNEDARRKAMERVRANGLAMKLSDAEWQWDRKKLTFYFTAEKRVDFRNLVRDLASLFRTRIELKQIGVRDEAKRLDGVGRCGRQYCSASWLPELRPVNLGVAKDQRLSLNPAQISGACGRLMCSLRYEHEFYVQSRKRFPKEGKIVVTSLGEEKVVAIDIFSEKLTLRSPEGETRSLSLTDFNREIAAQRGEGPVEETPSLSNGDSEDEAGAGEYISPELLYTAEHDVMTISEVIEAEPATDRAVEDDQQLEPKPEDASPPQSPARDERARRRRGRRGGRRGRGSDQGER
ncbi:MAG TPA: regulatory iron-sulfur-containing complex subunit RicT [Gemmatimonadaceae bacterium]